MSADNVQNQLSFNGLAVLYQIAHLLASGRKLDEIMATLLEILEEQAGMQRGMITILSPDNEELAVDVARGLSVEEKKARLKELATRWGLNLKFTSRADYDDIAWYETWDKSIRVCVSKLKDSPFWEWRAILAHEREHARQHQDYDNDVAAEGAALLAEFGAVPKRYRAAYIDRVLTDCQGLGQVRAKLAVVLREHPQVRKWLKGE